MNLEIKKKGLKNRTVPFFLVFFGGEVEGVDEAADTNTEYQAHQHQGLNRHGSLLFRPVGSPVFW